MVRCRIHLCWMPRTFHFRHFTRTCSCSSQPFTCTYFLGSTLRFLHLYWCFGCKCFTCIFAPVTTVQHFSLPLARNDEVSFLFKLVFGLGVAVAQRTFFLQHLTLAFAHMQNSDLVTYVLSFFNASTCRYSSEFYQFHETNGKNRHEKEKGLNGNDSVKEKSLKQK